MLNRLAETVEGEVLRLSSTRHIRSDIEAGVLEQTALGQLPFSCR